MELTNFEFVMYGTIAIMMVANVIGSIIRIFQGKRINTRDEDFLNTRVGKSGVRVGAALDALNSRARDRTPTDWR